jgi:UDP-N-acetylglucosamine pyrophosphorylase
MQKQIIILAAGKGSRMKSDLPKVMHKVGGKPMLQMVVDNSYAISNDLILVYSDHIAEYLPIFEKHCKLVLQNEQLGTAHAVWVASSLINNNIQNAVIYGDNPLITSQIITELFNHLESSKAAVAALVFEHEEPNAYGRIVLDEKGNLKKIVEFKVATDLEKKIKLCNSGIMAFAPGILQRYLPLCVDQLRNRSGNELYLTEIIEICSSAGEKVSYYTSKNNHRLVIGINTQEELDAANNILNQQN